MAVLDEVIHVVAIEFEIPEVKLGAGTDLTRDLGADSLDILSLLTRLEDRFRVRIPDSDIEKIRTVGQTAELIRSVGGQTRSEL